MKMDLPDAFRAENRLLKSLFSSSDSRRTISLVPTCKMIRVMECGNDCRRSGSSSVIVGTVAPGKQKVVELKNLMFRIMESPTMAEVGGNKGRGRGGEHRGSESGAGAEKTPERLALRAAFLMI